MIRKTLLSAVLLGMAVSCLGLEKEKSLVEIYRLSGESSRVLSECRWVKAFGANFWISGR